MRGRRRERAIKRAMEFVEERLNAVDGLGGIFPAMVNAVLAMEELGYAKDDPRLLTAKKAVDALLVVKDDEAYCQPCVSPVWDTGLAALAMMEAKNERESPMMAKCADWLLEREIKDVKGDWSWQKPDLAPGGWAFQYRNDYYPDVDDTAVVDGARPHERSARQGRDPARRDVDPRHAEQEWRLGRVRYRQ